MNNTEDFFFSSQGEAVTFSKAGKKHYGENEILFPTFA